MFAFVHLGRLDFVDSQPFKSALLLLSPFSFTSLKFFCVTHDGPVGSMPLIPVTIEVSDYFYMNTEGPAKISVSYMVGRLHLCRSAR